MWLDWFDSEQGLHNILWTSNCQDKTFLGSVSLSAKQLTASQGRVWTVLLHAGIILP